MIMELSDLGNISEIPSHSSVRIYLVGVFDKGVHNFFLTLSLFGVETMPVLCG
jgi:hypothetical protein